MIIELIPYDYDTIHVGDAWDVNYDELNRLRRNGYSDLTEYFMYFRCQIEFCNALCYYSIRYQS